MTDRTTRPLLVLNLRGSQAEMGSQHGQLLRAAGGWEPAFDYYPGLVARQLADENSRSLGRRLVERALRPVIGAALGRLHRARPTAYRARSDAFFEALGVSPSLAPSLMIMDVFQNLVGLAGRLRLGPFGRRLAHALPPACSTLAVWGAVSADGELRHARNFDFPGIGVWDQAPTVVLCAPDEGLRYGFVTTRGADVPGVSAFNEAGLVVTMHTRLHRDVASTGAAVIDLGHDIVRRAETLQDAQRVAAERRVASTWGIAVSSGRERRAIARETTAKGVVVAPAERPDDHLRCTNRNRHATLMRGELSPSPAFGWFSDAREQRMTQLVTAARERGGMTAEDLEAVLGDLVDAESGERRAAGAVIAQSMAVQSLVAEPALQQIRVSVGTCPSGFGPYVTVPWSWDRPVGSERLDTELPATHAGGEAHVHMVEATRVSGRTHDAALTLAEVEQAVRLDPDEPTYRFLAGLLRLRLGLPAVPQFEHGLRHEPSAFRRGQLLLWGARAADVERLPDRARAMRSELLALTHPDLGEHHAAARAELRRPYPAARLARLTVNMNLIDAM